MKKGLRVLWFILFTLINVLLHVIFNLKITSVLLIFISICLLLLNLNSDVKKRGKVHYYRNGLFVIGFKAYKVNKSKISFDPLSLMRIGFNKIILLKLNNACYVVIFAKALTLRSLLDKLSQIKVRNLREVSTLDISLSLNRVPLNCNYEMLNLSRDKNYLLVIENNFSRKRVRKRLLIKASLFSITPGFEKLYNVSALDMVHINCVKNIISFILKVHERKLVTGCIRIGWSVRRKEEIRVNLKPHVGVFGTTGMGKTTLLALIARELHCRGCRVLFISMSDYVPLLRGFKYLIPGVHFGVNPLNLMSLDRAIEVLEESSVAVYGEVGRFSPIVRVILEEALKNSSNRNVRYVIDYLSKWLIKENREDIRHGIEALLRRLSHLNCSAFKSERDICELLNKYYCLGITLSPIDSTIGKCVFILTLLNRVFDYWDESLGQLYVIIDEVHKLVSSESLREPILEVMMREGRNKNITLVLSSQALHDLHYSIKANITTYFFFRLPNPADSKAAASIIEVGNVKLFNRIASSIQKLPIATCIYYQDGSWELVKIRPLKLFKFNYSPRKIALKHNVCYLKLMNVIKTFTKEEIIKMLSEIDSKVLIDLGIMKVNDDNEVHLTNLGKALLEYYGISEDILRYYTIFNRIQKICKKYGVSEERMIKALERIQRRLNDKSFGEFIKELLVEEKVADLNFLKITDFSGKLTKLGVAILELLNLKDTVKVKNLNSLGS